MSNLILKQKIESRQHSKKYSIKNKNIFSLDTIGSINKERTAKKILNDLSLNYLKNYTLSSYPNNTCVNHSHKKIIINQISKPYNKKIFQNLSKAKFKKYPLKLNYKQSKSLKDLLEEEKLLNLNLRPNHTRKNTNTKIELFSTNSTLSFLNVKDSNKDILKPTKMKTVKDNSKIKEKDKKFSASFIENKIRQYIKNNSNNKNQKFWIEEISPNKSYKVNITKTNKNKSIECFSSYKKYINKKRNVSYGINENSNTNSIKEFYNINIKKTNTKSSNFLLDNISFSLNKNKNRIKSKNKLIKKNPNSKFNKTCSINNNKKLNLCSLPNLLCNNYIFNLNDKNKDSVKNYKNRNSYQNLLEHKRKNKNCNKIKIIDNKKIRKLFKNFKKINKDDKNNKRAKYSKSEEKINMNKIINNNNIEDKLKKIENGVKSILSKFYSVYLNTKHPNIIQKSNLA